MIKRTLCIETPCHLKCANGQLVVSYAHVKGLEEKPDRSVPIEDIGLLVVEHRQVTMSHYLLGELVANNTAVVTCDDAHLPTGLLLPLEGNTVASERAKAQVEASLPLKKQLWQQTVKAKIQNQGAVLEKFGVAHAPLSKLAQMVKSGDADNHEAQAAAYYWHNLFPPAWEFYRRRDGPPPNNLLNYGYAIIRAVMARALVGAGLIPLLGIFHRNRYNAYCLADDMMEPYRPFVDTVVRAYVEETSHVGELSQAIKVKLLQVPAADVWLDGAKSPMMVAMQRTAVSLVKCFEGEQRKLLLPEMGP